MGLVYYLYVTDRKNGTTTEPTRMLPKVDRACGTTVYISIVHSLRIPSAEKLIHHTAKLWYIDHSYLTVMLMIRHD